MFEILHRNKQVIWKKSKRETLV